MSVASSMGGPGKEKWSFWVSDWLWCGDLLFEGVWRLFWSPVEHVFACFSHRILINLTACREACLYNIHMLFDFGIIVMFVQVTKNLRISDWRLWRTLHQPCAKTNAIGLTAVSNEYYAWWLRSLVCVSWVCWSRESSAREARTKILVYIYIYVYICAATSE